MSSLERTLSRRRAQLPPSHPGGLMPVMPQPQPQVPMPKQTTYPSVVIDVQAMPDGNRMLVIQAPGEVLLFPMNGEYADALGKKLTAPHIVPASNGHGPPR